MEADHRSYRRVPRGREPRGPSLAVQLAALGVVCLSGLGFGFRLRAQSFRAGAATSNITPRLGVSINGGMRDRTAVHIHDELRARAIVLDDGKTQIAIVVCDSCMLPRRVCDGAKRRIAELSGVPPHRVLIAATHSHSCPTATPVFQSDSDEDYVRFVTTRIADAARRAFNQLEPARVGWGSGSEPRHVFNRRWRMKEGTIPPDPFGRRTDQVQMNPPRGSPNLIEPISPTDPEIPVLAVQSTTGRPLAVLANYSLHYVGGTGSGHISADYFGMFADRLEQLVEADHQEPPFVAVLSNGTSGDINNIDFRNSQPSKGPYGQMRLVANDVALEAARVIRGITYLEAVSLDMRQTTLELGVRLPSEDDVKRARDVLAKTAGDDLRRREEIYARETLLLSEYPPRVELVLQALRIDDLAIVAIPCEVFVEIGLELKKKSPFPSTFVIELANGYNGYLPTVPQHTLGGYETWRARSSYLEEAAAPKITARLLALLQELQPANDGRPGGDKPRG